MARQTVYRKMSEYQPRLPSNNAYDYYISAARQLKGSEAYAGNQQPPTHAEMQWVERQRGVFNTLRQGYTKPYWWPFKGIGISSLLDELERQYSGFVNHLYGIPLSFQSDIFDDLARLRSLARFINTRIRWAIATKDGMDAVNDWRIGFKMARDIQGDAPLAYLSGVAMEATIHAPIIREIDFFSAQECREIARTLIESERTPDRIGSVIESELSEALRAIDIFLPPSMDLTNLKAYLKMNLNQRKALLNGVTGEDVTEEREALEAGIQRLEMLETEIGRLQNQPGIYQQLRSELRREIVRGWQAVADAVALQGGRYRPLQRREYDRQTLFGYIAGEMLAVQNLADAYWYTRTRRRLMIAHLLLREYRLREGRYPASLEELNLRELAIDPFSGHPFVYRLAGERYLLYSVGLDGKDDGGHRGYRGLESGASEHARDLFLTREGWR